MLSSFTLWLSIISVNQLFKNCRESLDRSQRLCLCKDLKSIGSLDGVIKTHKSKVPQWDVTWGLKVPFRWDTAGQEDFGEARKTCYPGTEILLIGFSHGEPDSLENVETVWQKESKLDGLKNAPVGSTSQSMIMSYSSLIFLKVLLVGLKGDLIDDEATKEQLAQRDKVNPSS